MKKLKSYTGIWNVEKVLYAISDFNLPFPVALTWFMSQKTFDGKKPYSFIKSEICYAVRPKVTYAGKAVKLEKETLKEAITAVRSVSYVPD